MAIRKIPVTTVILAGGLGKRMGGDKGLQLLHGRALLSWVLDAIRRDSEAILINANTAHGTYADFGFRVVADLIPGWPGPLAGLHAALHRAQTEYVLTVPCDTPFLPEDLTRQLFAAITKHDSEAAVVVTGGRRQPAITLYHKSVLPKLAGYLDGGERKVNDWLNRLRLSEVVFDNVADFDNINTQDELSCANRMPVRARYAMEFDEKNAITGKV